MKTPVGSFFVRAAHTIRLDSLVFFLVVHVVEPLFPSARMKEEQSFFSANNEEIHQLTDLFFDTLSRRTFTACLQYRQYGTRFPRDVIQPDQDKYFPPDLFTLDADTFIDCGAFNGDSVSSFISHSNRTGKPYRHIFAFELSAYNYNVLEKKIQNQHIERISTYQQGVSDSKANLRFNTKGEVSEIARVDPSGDENIQVVRLDDALAGQMVTFIKMDIEGHELEALKGAENIIQHNEPILAICTYHSYQDFLQVPLAMHQLMPKARLYLRHYGKNWMETVCYAIPPKRTTYHTIEA